MTEAVISTLKKHNIDVSFLRGQAYNNAKNMSGIYSGLQARIREISPLADFVPCSAHSLNFIGSCAASCRKEANSFFNFVQNIYTFFSASTHRWNLLKVSSTLKNLSETRWSARVNACKALNKNWETIKTTLYKLSNDLNENPITSNEAFGLFLSMNRLETTFMSLFWGDLLQRFNIVSKYLQSINIDICTVCDQYEALINYIINLRKDDMFQQYHEKSIKKFGVNQYETTSKRKKKKRIRQHDELNDKQEVNLTGSVEFKVNTYFVICDSFIEELTYRKVSYDNAITKFTFFLKLTEKKPSEVRLAAERLRSIYMKDLDTTFINECIYFQDYIQSIKDPPKTIIAVSTMIKREELNDIYPYVSIAIRMFLCIPCSNCSAERSFSTLRRVKTYLRSSLSNDRLNALAFLSIEAEITKLIKYDDVIDDFATIQARKKKYNQSCLFNIVLTIGYVLYVIIYNCYGAVLNITIS